MTKHIGNRIGSSVANGASDGGVFNSFSQFFYQKRSNWITYFGSGGTVTATGIAPGNGYRYHVFTAPGNFTTSSSGTIDVLIIGGGGGAANPLAGGGGAGGVVRHSSYPIGGSGSYPIVVGTGGAGAPQGTPAPGPAGVKGGSSTAFGMTADGGGGGGPYDGSVPNLPDMSGGSGGGGRTYPTPGPTVAGSATQPTLNAPFVPSPFFTQYGNPGGTGGSDPKGAGGGGAGAAGSPGGGTGNGPGGAGQPFPAFAAPLISPEIPAPVVSAWITAVGPTGLYGGGGGGGGRDATSNVGGIGGSGGGGNGAPSPTIPAGCRTPGIKYTGGGGGGGSYSSCNTLPASPGGDGIVIIRYLSS